MSLGTQILDVLHPDDFGEMYVPFIVKPGIADFGGMLFYAVWPDWLPQRDYFYRGAP